MHAYYSQRNSGIMCGSLTSCRCPFPFELNLDAVVTAYCGVEMRLHALATVLMMPTTAERERTVKVRVRVASSEQ